MTRDVHRMTRDVHRMTRDVHRMTRDVHRMTRDVHRMTRDVHRMTRDVYSVLIRDKQLNVTPEQKNNAHVLDHTNTGIAEFLPKQCMFENCARMGYYVASCVNSLPTFRKKTIPDP
jgi:hypothetical protein